MKSYELLLKELSIINNSTKDISSISYSLVLHNKDADISIPMFDTLEIKGDYNNNVGDINIMHFNMGTGDFVYDVIKYKNNLELTVLKYVNNKLYQNTTYKAILVNDEGNYSGVQSNSTRDHLNKASMTKVVMQLVDKQLEVLRTINVDGIYRDVNVKDMLYGMISNNTDKIKINGEKIKSNITIVPTDNNTVYGSILVPTGTKLVDVPTYLQDTKYGVYYGDIGFYIKNIRSTILDYVTNFFVYPLYSKKDDDFDSLYIYHADTNFNKSSDNTYYFSDKMLKIISAKVEGKELGQKRYMDSGASLTGSNMNNIRNYDNSTVTDGEVNFNSKSQVSNESYSTEDGINNEKYVGNEPNMFRRYASVTNNELDLYTVHWNYSDCNLLRPGMKVTLFYQIDKEIRNLKGVLQGHYSVYSHALKNERTLLMIKLGEVNG